MAEPMLGRIAFIGAGQMAEALVGGLLDSGESPDFLYAGDPSLERREIMKRRFGIRVGPDNHDAAIWADSVVLAVKPQALESVTADLRPVLKGKLVISIVAGRSLAWLGSRIPGARLVRVMPNAPALVREGISALAFGPDVSTVDRRLAEKLFEAVGKIVYIEERDMEAVTGLSGSGPAYVFIAIEALADGGVKMGLSRPAAELLAVQTVLGEARMVREAGGVAGLKTQVASPDGATEAGLRQLADGTFRASVIEAIVAATQRARELGKA
jgi:pyrroline-5-carboxylate reductase